MRFVWLSMHLMTLFLVFRSMNLCTSALAILASHNSNSYFAQTIQLLELYVSKISGITSVMVSMVATKEQVVPVEDCTSAILKHIYSERWLNAAVELKYFLPSSNEESNELQKPSSVRYIKTQFHLIIVWDVETINELLNQNRLLEDSRTFGLIVYLKIGEEATSLELMWLQYYVLNVVAIAPDTNERSMVYRYDPFLIVGSKWGSMAKFNMEQLLSEPKLLFNNFGDMDSYPLKVMMFERIPTAVSFQNATEHLLGGKVYKSMKSLFGFVGLDACLLAEMAAHLNFTPVLVRPQYPDTFGEIWRNGSGIGAFGAVGSRTVAIASNGVYIRDYKTDKIEFLVPYSASSLCIIVPKSARIPQWMQIFSCFTSSTWIVLLAIIVLFSLLWGLFISNKFSDGWYYVLAICLSVTVRIQSSALSQSIYLVLCLGFSLVTTSIFQGNLVKSFSRETYFPELNDLNAIDKSGLQISTRLNIFVDIPPSLRYRFESKHVTDAAVKSIDRAAYKRDVCAVERKEDAKFLIDSIYVSPEGVPLLYITKECPFTYYAAFIVPKGSPFLPKFNSVTMRFVEGGFIGKWYKDVTVSITIHRRMTETNKNTRKVFAISDVQAIFYMWFCGLIFTAIVFVFEMQQL